MVTVCSRPTLGFVQSSLVATFTSPNMSSFILFITGVVIAGAIGFWAGVKNANSSKVSKFKDIEDSLKK